jgi:hypothetical protein
LRVGAFGLRVERDRLRGTARTMAAGDGMATRRWVPWWL